MGSSAPGGGRGTLSDRIASRCRELGFAAVGVSSLEPSRYAAEFRAWLAQGRHGEMRYLEDELEVRLHPSRLLPHARAALVVADLYATRGDSGVQGQGAASGRIAKYAAVRDYHRVMKRRLHSLCDELRREFPGAKFRTVVDTAPVLERELAQRAGIGWVGKHTLLIHPRLGSWFFLGAVFTTLPLEPIADQPIETDHCGSCTRCIDACPTRAITPYSVDATRCISYLTIEHRSMIADSLHAAMGDWVYGCDVCQDVCPHNSPRGEGANLGVVAGEYGAARAPGPIALDELLTTDEFGYRNLFRSTPMWRITADLLKRNALITAGNAVRKGKRELLTVIERIAWDAREPELVRGTARQVLRSLGLLPGG